jgi:hypothetical protein
MTIKNKSYAYELKINIKGTFQYYANHNSTAELVGYVSTLKSNPVR